MVARFPAGQPAGSGSAALRERPGQVRRVHADDEQRDQREVDGRDERAVERLDPVVGLLLGAAGAERFQRRYVSNPPTTGR